MKYTFQDLLNIMATLRSENGCPWDRQQTHLTLLPYLVEESHEYIDAVQANDKVHMAEELGDVLFQVVFHSQVAKESNDFSIDDVIQGICEKMLRRHPHVFGDAKVDDASEVTRRWEKIKAGEASNQGCAHASFMDKVSKSLPTLARAQELQRRAAKVGFDWVDSAPVFDKVVEEFQEFREEQERSTGKSVERMEDEFGDIMFSLVNVARHSGFNAALALERANSKFEKRFREVECEVQSLGKTMSDIGLDGLQQIWNDVKKRQNATN